MRIALALLLVGCVAPADSELPTPPPGDQDPEPQPEPPRATDRYTMRTEVDLTVNAVLPEPAHEMVGVLRDFETAPSRTLFDVAEAAGVPAVAELRDALPAYVEDKLYGWLDGEIAKVELGGTPITQIAGNLAALAESVLTRFAIDSALVIDDTTATHRLAAIDFAPAGLDTRFELGALPSEVVSATTSCTSRDATLTIGDHGYAIAYGEYVWQALEREMTATYGGTIRTKLGEAIDCPAIAATVATRCVWGVCVGHAAELTQICERGLDEVVARVHAKIATLRFDALHLAAGTATIGAGELTGGVWTAELNAGMGLRAVPATFTATR